MIMNRSHLKKLSKRLKRWHHLLFFLFVITIILYYLIGDYPATNRALLPLTVAYTSGRILLIAIVSSSLALIGGFIIGILHLLPIFKWFHTTIKALFYFPTSIYAFLFFSMTPLHTPLSILLIFALLRLYPVMVTLSKELKKLKQEHYIIQLTALGVSPFRIILIHILPEAISPLFLEFLHSIIWIVGMELLVTVTGILHFYPSEPTLGYLIFHSLQQGDHHRLLFFTLYFTLFYVELKYMTQVLRFHFGDQFKHQSSFKRF